MNNQFTFTVFDTVVEVRMKSGVFYRRPKELITLPSILALARGRFAAVPEIIPRELTDKTALSEVATITVNIPERAQK